MRPSAHWHVTAGTTVQEGKGLGAGLVQPPLAEVAMETPQKEKLTHTPPKTIHVS